MESLSAYARQFLGRYGQARRRLHRRSLPRDIDRAEEHQQEPTDLTVGTVTEIYDYLRLLYARIGVHHCPKCDSPIRPQSPENITSLIMSENGESLVFLAPVIRGIKGTHEQVIDDLIKQGFTKLRIDQKIYESSSVKKEAKIARYEKHWIEAVVDRVKIDEEDRSRVSEAVEVALQVGKGTMMVIGGSKRSNPKKKEIERFEEETLYSTFGACPNHPEMVFENLEPRMFSFNSPFGACPACHGLGEITQPIRGTDHTRPQQIDNGGSP